MYLYYSSGKKGDMQKLESDFLNDHYTPYHNQQNSVEDRVAPKQNKKKKQ